MANQNPEHQIIWPRWMGKQPQQATNVAEGAHGFVADQLSEPLKLGKKSEVIGYAGPDSLKAFAGDTIKVARIEGKTAVIRDSGIGHLPSVAADMDLSFGFQENQYMERLRGIFKVNQRVGDDLRQGLGIEWVPDERALVNIRRALSGETPNELFEAVSSLNQAESAILLAEMDFNRETLNDRIILAKVFVGKLRVALRNNIDPDHEYSRLRDRFVLRPHELASRFKTIEEHVDDYAVNSAEDVMEHYAVVSRFIEPSKDQHLDRILGCLKHPMPMVKSYMAGALVFLKPARAYEHLLPLLNDEKRVVYKAAIMALGELRDERAVDRIKKFVRHKDPEVREITVAALIAIGGEEAYQVMKKRLRHEPDMVIRDDIERGLAALEDRGFGLVDNTE